MSKRALEAGMKAFPEKIVGTKHTPFGNEPIDENIPKRIYFMEGYKQAEIETINRAIDWIKTHTSMSVYEQELFRKEMKEE